MSENNAEENDSFNYLSFLTNDSSDNMANNDIECVDVDDSDVDYSDDECLIVGVFDNSGKSEKESIDLNKEKELIEEKVDKIEDKFDVKSEEYKVFEDIKRDFGPKQMFDCKPDVKTFDLKHKIVDNFDVKDSNLRSEEYIDKIESKQELKQTNIEHKLDSQVLSESSDRDRLIVTSITSIVKRKQSPRFKRLFSLCSQQKQTFPEFGNENNFLLVLESAKSRNIIEEYVSTDGSVSYRLPKNKSKSTKKMRITCFDISDNSDSDDEQESNNHLTGNPFNSNKSDEKTIEDLGNLSDCDNFEAIDMNSSQIFSNIEIDSTKLPNILESTQSPVKEHRMTSQTNTSPNYIRNKEVIRKRTAINQSNDSSDNEDEYSPIGFDNWVLETLPRYTPFIGQKGDIVMYLKDVHELYVKFELKQLVRLYDRFNCTSSKASNDEYIITACIMDIKFFMVEGIQFSVITLRNSLKSDATQFNVLYRPNQGIPEFLILEKHYKSSVETDWKVGSQFRSIWKKSWWIGIITNKIIYDQKYPNSLFRCFQVDWDSDETGVLSPWDLFPVDPNRVPKNKKNGILISKEDLFIYNYKPTHTVVLNEWPVVENIDSDKWRSHECKRIFKGIKAIERKVSKSLVESFYTFNAKNTKPIPYPITLQTIKDRLRRFFYRRVKSIEHDVKLLKINSKLSHKKCDHKIAEDFVELIEFIVLDNSCDTDEQYLKYINDFPDLFDAKVETTSTSTSTSTSAVISNNTSNIDHNYSSNKVPNNRNVSKRKCSTNSLPAKKKTRNTILNCFQNSPSSSTSSSSEQSVSHVITPENSRWIADTHRLINDLLKNDKSLPFRQPVDITQYPDYYNVIKHPTDLSAISEQLNNGYYRSPKDLREDFRLMFANCRAYTKNPKQPIRIFAKELMTMCEDRLREIIVDWERILTYETKKKNGRNARQPISKRSLWGFGTEEYF